MYQQRPIGQQTQQQQYYYTTRQQVYQPQAPAYQANYYGNQQQRIYPVRMIANPAPTTPPSKVCTKIDYKMSIALMLFRAGLLRVFVPLKLVHFGRKMPVLLFCYK